MTLTLPRIYYPDSINLNGIITIEQNIYHYITNVMRLKNQALFKIFNAKNGEFLVEIIEISKKSLKILVKEILSPSKIPNIEITLLFSPIKHHRMQIMIEKATELGVTAFQPILMQHSVVRDFNINKYTQIATEAVEQSGRFVIPKFCDIIKFNELKNTCQDKPILWACERSESTHTSLPKQQEYYLLIGPEGGFSEQEKLLLSTQLNIKTVSLGDFILRAETAAIALCSWVNYA